MVIFLSVSSVLDDSDQSFAEILLVTETRTARRAVYTIYNDENKTLNQQETYRYGLFNKWRISESVRSGDIAKPILYGRSLQRGTFRRSSPPSNLY